MATICSVSWPLRVALVHSSLCSPLGWGYRRLLFHVVMENYIPVSFFIGHKTPIVLAAYLPVVLSPLEHEGCVAWR